MLNLADFLDRNARLFPGQRAIVFGETELTYGALWVAANTVANALMARGIKPGDKVAITCPNLPYFPIVYYGILKAGAVVVPINVLLKPAEIKYHLEDSEARAYFCFEGQADLPMGDMGREAFAQCPGCELFVLLPADPSAIPEMTVGEVFNQFIASQSSEAAGVMTNADDSAVILYTSGTTGRAKGAELSHANMAFNAQSTTHLIRMTWQDVTLVTLPLFHSFGQTCQMNAAIMVGATIVMVPRFEPGAVFDLLRSKRVTFFAGVPTMFIALNAIAEAKPEEASEIRESLRLVICGGAPTPVEVIKAFDQHFDVPMLEGYGLSEVSPVASFNHLDRPRKTGTVGQSIVGIEVGVVGEDGEMMPPGQDGEVVIRGNNVMKGYYKRPEATADVMRNGWFHAGDIGRLDEEGYLSIVDRVKDMVIRGGFNVYPREIEEVLMEHAAVEMVAVIGVPHATHGEEIAAYAVAKPGAVLDPDELREWAKERLAAFKYPRIVKVVDALPLNATGKILKRELRDQYNG